MIECATLFPLLKRLNVRPTKILIPLRSQKSLKAVSDTFHLFQMCLTRHRPVMKHATVARRHYAVGCDRSAVFANGASEKLG